MANIVGMQRAIKAFFDYLLRNPDQIPNDHIGRFIQQQMGKILLPTLLACLEAKGEKVAGNLAHVVAATYLECTREFLSKLLDIINARLAQKRIEPEVQQQIRKTIICEYVLMQRNTLLKGPFGGDILFKLDPDSPKPNSNAKGLWAISSSSMIDDYPREQHFVAANQFYSCHSILFRDVNRERMTAYNEECINIVIQNDYSHQSIQARLHLHDEILQLLKLDWQFGRKYWLQMVSMPLDKRIFDALFELKNLPLELVHADAGQRLASNEALAILKANLTIANADVRIFLVDKLNAEDFMSLWNQKIRGCSAQVDEFLLATFLLKAPILPEDDIVKIIGYYFSSADAKRYLNDSRLAEYINTLAPKLDLIFKLCLTVSPERLKTVFNTFPLLHCLNNLARFPDVEEVGVDARNVLLVCQADPARFALLKNLDVIKRFLNAAIIQALWQHQSWHDLTAVVEITYSAIANKEFNLLQLILQYVPTETIAKIYQRLGGDAKMQALLKQEFDRELHDNSIKFLRRLIANKHVTTQKLSVLHDNNLIMPQLSSFTGPGLLGLLVALTEPEMSDDFTLKVDAEITKFIATNFFNDVVKQIGNYAKDDLAAVLRCLPKMPPSIAEKLFSQLHFSENDLVKFVVTEAFQRQNPLRTSYLHGNAFSAYAGRSLVTEYFHELNSVNAVVQSIRHANAPTLACDSAQNVSVNLLAVMENKVDADSFSPLLYHYCNYNILFERKDVLAIVFASHNQNLIEQYCWKFILFGHNYEILESMLMHLANLSKEGPVEFINAKLIAAMIRKAYHLTYDHPHDFISKLLSCGLRSAAFEQLPSLRALIGQLIVWDQKINRQAQTVRPQKKSNKSYKSKGSSWGLASSMSSYVPGSFAIAVDRSQPKNILQNSFLTAMFKHLSTFSAVFASPENVRSFLQEYETATPLLARDRNRPGAPLPDQQVVSFFTKLLEIPQDGQFIGHPYVEKLTMAEIEQILTRWVDPHNLTSQRLVTLFLNACSAVILANRNNAVLLLSKVSDDMKVAVLCDMYAKLDYGFAQSATLDTMTEDMRSCGANNVNLALTLFEHKVYTDIIFESTQNLLDFLDALAWDAISPFFNALMVRKPTEKNVPTIYQLILAMLSLEQITSLLRSAFGFTSVCQLILLDKIKLMKLSPGDARLTEIENSVTRLLRRQFPNSEYLVTSLFLEGHEAISEVLTVDHLVLAINLIAAKHPQVARDVILGFPIHAAKRHDILQQLIHITFNTVWQFPDLRITLLQKLITTIGITDKNDSWLRQCFDKAENCAFKPVEIVFALAYVAKEFAVGDAQSKRLAVAINKILLQIFKLDHAEGFLAQCQTIETAAQLTAGLSNEFCSQMVHAFVSTDNLGQQHSPAAHRLMKLCLHQVLVRKHSTFAVKPADVGRYLSSNVFYFAPPELRASDALLRDQILRLFSQQHGYELISQHFPQGYLLHLGSEEVRSLVVDHLQFAVQSNLVTPKVMMHFDMLLSSNSQLLVEADIKVFSPRLKKQLSDKEWKQYSVFVNGFIDILYLNDRSFATSKKMLLACHIQQNLSVIQAIFASCSLSPEIMLDLYQELVLPNQGLIPQTTREYLFSLCVPFLAVKFDAPDICQQLADKLISPQIIDLLLEDFASSNKNFVAMRVNCGDFMSAMLLLLSNDIVLPEVIMTNITYLLGADRNRAETFVLCCNHATFKLMASLNLNCRDERQQICRVLHQRRLAEGHIFIENDMMFNSDNGELCSLPIYVEDVRQLLYGFQHQPGNSQQESALLELMQDYLQLNNADSHVSVARVFEAFDLLDGSASSKPN